MLVGTHQPQFQFFDHPAAYYAAVINDITQATKYVFIETYKFIPRGIGVNLRNVLSVAAKKGVEVKILIDSWSGSNIPEDFFDDLKAAGGEIRLFQKIKINIDIFTRGHRRNHRKLILIDDHISYIGSSNLTDYNFAWRESVLRIKGTVALTLKKVFYQDFKIYNRFIRYRSLYTRVLRHDGFEIIRDVPSISRQKINKRFQHLIKNATSEIIIETPYFLPGFMLRNALIDAANRGVEVKVIIPKHSDVRIVNILHGRYLDMLHYANISLLYFTRHNLHAKLMLIDGKTYAIGSPNFDYRSFRYMHEIVILGQHTEAIALLRKHINESIAHCEPFNHEVWQRRPFIQKFFEWLVLPIRHLL
jgi:cardiolipin synthase A/B